MNNNRTIYALAFVMMMAVFGCEVGGTEPRSDGSTCGWASQCDGAVCMVAEVAGQSTGWFGGLCSRMCANGSCPDGGVCTNLGDGLYCLPSCQASSDCREGYVCDTRLSACLPPCGTSGCLEGFSCADDGLCYFDWSGLGQVGVQCEEDAECKSGFCIRSVDEGVFTGWTGGMCTDVCGAKECEAGASCVILSGEAWCLPACDSETPCREGYVCREDWSACLPDCTLGWLCGDGFLCMADGTCKVALPVLEPVGAGCVADADCASGWCLEESDPALGPTGWQGGTCSLPCGYNVGCSAGASCIILEAAGWCLQPCTPGQEPVPCREGYVCDPFLNACLPHCANAGWDCGAQYTCRSDGVCGTQLP